MYSERDIQRKVKSVVDNVVEPEQEYVTPDQLTEILTKSISSCILSQDLIDRVDREIAMKIRRRR